jgi:hypothetical protein
VRATTISNTATDQALPTRPEVVALLRDILSELQLIRHDLARQRRPSHLTRRDRQQLARLLPAVAGVIGSEWVTARELVDHPAAGLRLVCDGLNARALGRLFQRAEGAIIDGLVIEHGGHELGAGLWRVMRQTP